MGRCPYGQRYHNHEHDACRMCSAQRKARLKELLETPQHGSFSALHAEIEQLMGRPVWTHELALPQELYDELDGKPVHGLIDKIFIIRGEKDG